MKTKLIIEPHIHGAFGIDFNKATVDEMCFVAKELLSYGIGGFLPTLVTDSITNTKKQIEIIKLAAKKIDESFSKILGIHLEGIFINKNKKGIHNPEHFLELTVENYKLIEDDFIKIITLAPELDVNLLDYLKNKKIKIQAGHCIGSDLKKCDGVTHLFNAMKGISHRESSTVLSALIDDNIYTEVIADGLHINNDTLKLIFKIKPADKIILISDALPITYSKIKKTVFADSVIYYDGIKATSKEGTLAGSTTLVPQIIKRLISNGLFNKKFIDIPYAYLGVDIDGELEWNSKGEIISIIKSNKKVK
jgi:N-acetylglucosamine-6-phosphate deacetylase